MSTKLVAVSLKMYFDHVRTLEWAREVRTRAASHPKLSDGLIDLVLLPDHASLAGVIQIFEGTPVRVGAQDLSWADSGAYTGDVSGVTLRQVGCTLAEIGHAERALHHGEDSVVAGAKLHAALRNGLQPLVCVGEAEQGNPVDAADQCLSQWDAMWERVPEAERTSRPEADPVLAYEPVWSIGADAPAPAGHIIGVVNSLRSSGRLQPGTRIIYGGSAGPKLVPSLASAVDGFFLGRRAHDPDALLAVVDALSSSS
ncbi:triose-phosphate isomerase family protein [Microbacterium schleiferi]|uniref:triose-phosphate isomerase family protein n=1 Tax=Microbacterium schleiferi TaxID=69362 RepID=UPI00311E7CD2